MRFGVYGDRGDWEKYSNLNEKCKLGKLWEKSLLFWASTLDGTQSDNYYEFGMSL